MMVTVGLSNFRKDLEARLPSAHSRPFVCDGSPLACRSFVVGLNAATQLSEPFTSYWSDETGFDRRRFESDYAGLRKRQGNRPVIEAIAREIDPCLETNLYAVPTRKAKDLTPEDKQDPLIEYLFDAIRPTLVFVHSNEPIRFFETVTGCTGFTAEPKQAEWLGHQFWLYGRPGPLYTLGAKKGREIGATLAGLLQPL